VIALYNSGGAYLNSPGITWHASWSGDGGLTDYSIPPSVKKYAAVQYSGVEFYGNPVNAAGCDTLHVSVWTTSDQFGLKVVSLTAGTQDPQINFPPGSLPAPDANGWYNLEIPISWLIATNGAFDASNIQQLLWLDNSGVGGGATGQDFYIDNVYFSSSTNIVHASVTKNVSASAATMTNPYLYDTTFGGAANGGGLPSLNASYSGTTLTFAPSTYGSIEGDNYVATLYDTDASLPGNAYAPSRIVFTGNCLSSTLDAGYTAVAFIRDFAADYSSSTTASVPLTNGQPFSVELTCDDSTHHIQWGFEMSGVAVANNSSLGNVQLAVAAAAQPVNLGSKPHGWSQGWYSDNIGNGNYWFGNNEWAIPVDKIYINSNGVSGAISVNMNPYYDSAGNSGVYDQVTGDPVVTNSVTYYVPDDSLLGAQVIFSGNCWSNTLSGEYAATAFVREFDSSYNLVGSTVVSLATGQPFAASYFATNGGSHLQYGLMLTGPAERRLPVDQVGTHGSLTVGTTLTPISLAVGSGISNAYANIFNDSARTSYAFGFPVGAAALPATVIDDGVVALAPNTAFYSASDSAWSTAGVPNKYVEANYYGQDGAYQSAGSVLPGHPLTFSGFCWSNTTPTNVTCVAFIQVFDPWFNRLSSTTAALAGGQPFSVSVTPAAGTVVQYGFQVLGLDYNPTNTDLGQVVVADVPLITVSGGSGSVVVTSNYTGTVSASGGAAPYTYSGTLPAGLSLNASNGVISGSVAVVGAYSFTVTATDADGYTGTEEVLVRVTPKKTDATKPTVKIVSPDKFGVLTSSPLTVTGTAADAGVLYAVHYSFDGGPTNKCVGTTNWSISIPAAAQGLHTILVQSEDVTGNLSLPVSLTLHYGTNVFVAGSYSGLFSSNGVYSVSNGGAFTLKVASTAGKQPTFTSGKVTLNGVKYSMPKGTFEMDGAATVEVPGLGSVTVNMPFDGSDTITGSINTTNSNLQMLGYRDTDTTLYDGYYTVVIPGATNSANEPGGNGYALVSISGGLIKATGSKLADGSAFKSSVAIGKNGEWPLYSGAAGNVIMGVLTVTTNGDISGTLTWDKVAGAAPVTVYPAGFTASSAAQGAKYTAAAFDATPLLTAEDYALSSMVTNTLGKFTFDKSEVKKLSIVPATGKVLAGIVAGAAAGEGVVLGTNTAYGYLLNSTNGVSSSFDLH